MEELTIIKKKENKFSTLFAVFLELKLKLRRHW